MSAILPSGRYRVSGVNNDASSDVTLTDLVTGDAVVLKNVPDGDLAQVRFNRDETGDCVRFEPRHSTL
jgi:hypothetical protein